MGLLGAVSTVAGVGTSVFKSVTSVGKSIFGAGKSIISSKFGKIALGVGAVAILTRNNSGLASGAKNLFSTITDKIKSVFGGVGEKAVQIANKGAEITEYKIDQFTNSESTTLANAASNINVSPDTAKDNTPSATTEQSSTETPAVDTPAADTPEVGA